MYLVAAIAIKKSMWHLVQRLGGPGLIALGLLDNSVIPLPGSMDASTILLAAAQREPWWYYALMATVGSLIGGYLTYRLGLRGGEETLEKKVSKRRADQIYRVFRRFGFWSIAGGALAPPPAPVVAVLITAGALKYPRNRFLAALALGRTARYALLAYLGHVYGRVILHWLSRYYQPLLYLFIALGVGGGLVALYYWRRSRNNSKRRPSATVAKKVA